MPWGSLSQQQITVLLRLLGGGPYKAEVTSSAAATMRLGGATEATGLAMRTAGRRTFIMNQALYTFRRYAFFGTVAALGLIGGLLKLGYSYLATRDSATAALSPIIHGQQAMNAELNQLFKLSKYSPFVMKDMTDALRVMYPALHGAGLGVHGMNQLLLSMTNILSQSGKTTPANLNKISYAIQHMIYQGRLTGRLVQSLATSGVNVTALLQRLGLAHANLSSISRLNISPQSVIKAITELGQSGIFKGAAQRIAMRSLPGMLQVLRDSMSQFMGIFLGGGYARAKSELSSLVGRGGLLDRLSNIKTNAGPQAALMALSTALTGHTGLGQGLMLLAHIAGNLGSIFIHSVVPAFVIGLHALILFAPILYPLNTALGFLAHHATLVRWALVPLAAWFVLTHGAMLGMYTGGKLVTIMLFGQVGAIRKFTIALMTAEGRTKLITAATRLWTLATKGQIFWTTVSGRSLGALDKSALTPFERKLVAVRAAVITTAASFWGWVTATYAEGGALLVLTRAIYAIPVIGWILLGITLLGLLIWKWRGFRNVVVEVLTTIGDYIQRYLIGPLNKAIGLFRHIPIVGGLLGRGLRATASAATGGIVPAFAGGVNNFAGGWAMVGERGPEILNLPHGSSITPVAKQVSPIGSMNDIGHGRDIVIHLRTEMNRRVLAEEVIRVQQDYDARR